MQHIENTHVESTPIENNHFYKNRNEVQARSFFKYWLEHTYLPRKRSFADTNVTVASATVAYKNESEAAAKYYEENKMQYAGEKLRKVLHKFRTVNKYASPGVVVRGLSLWNKECRLHRHNGLVVRVLSSCAWHPEKDIFTEIYQKVKRERAASEKNENTRLIKENIEKIIERCIEMEKSSSCSERDKAAYIAVRTILKEIVEKVNKNKYKIHPTDPLASGVIDLTNFGDSHMSQLPADVVELLKENDSLISGEVDLPQKIRKLLTKFVNTYEHLMGTEFRLRDMDGISYPRGIQDPQYRADAGTVFGVLNGLRDIWTCTPNLEDPSYSENAFVVEAISKILIPILGNCEATLARIWGEHMSESSRLRKVQMGAAASPNKPDLCIRLTFLDTDVELAFCEFSSLEMGQPKHRDDWRKSVRSCKDGHDMLRAVCFEGKATDCNEASILKKLLNNIPSIAILNKKTHLTISVIDTFNGTFFKAYEILDMDIPLKPVEEHKVEDLLKKALQLRRFFDAVVHKVKDVMTKGTSLPIDEDESDIRARIETLSITSTTFSP
ncbi:11365_t:CDS:2 [Paraglomus occultum]|uniref:11365_t:CDS:1 n=1 Tax=Paraglomus occultum TaxID=144539 RepID=A0A9N9F765_9GLOM|nr:11365_t:CDS:2 [Paraglomus occultum]